MRKPRYINVTDLNLMVDELKPNTLYEFSVKLVKGKLDNLMQFGYTNPDSSLEILKYMENCYQVRRKCKTKYKLPYIISLLLLKIFPVKIYTFACV